jgi:hypothetical protein
VKVEGSEEEEEEGLRVHKFVARLSGGVVTKVVEHFVSSWWK